MNNPVYDFVVSTLAQSHTQQINSRCKVYRVTWNVIAAEKIREEEGKKLFFFML